MAIPGSANLLLAGSAQAYQIEQSLFWNGLGYSSALSLRRTQGTATSNKICTFSTWQKKSNSSGNSLIFWGTASNQSGSIQFSGTQKAGVGTNLGLSGYNESVALHRDDGAWYHYVYQIDTTQATNTNRFKCWVNGVQITEWSPTFYPAQNSTWLFGGATQVNLCAAYNSSAQFSSQGENYIAETHFIDGTAYEPTDFGEFDDNGVWRPIKVAGLSYGNNGFYLTYDSSAANGVGHDHSGNGNHLTLTDTGSNTAVVSDTPTNNYATMNPLAVRPSYVPTFSDGNLKVTHRSGTGQYSHCGSTFAFKSDDSSGFYCEIQNGAQSYGGVSLIVTDYGVHRLDPDVSNGFSTNTNGGIGYDSNGYIRNFGTTIDYTSSYSYNGGSDILGIAVKANKVWFSINGSWIASGNPSTGANPVITLSSTQTFVVGSYGQGSRTFISNFGQRAFSYTVPTGFKAMSTSNLPAPDIADGSQYMNTVTWTGTGASRTIDFGMQPDWIWAKGRNTAANHRMSDNVRGGDGTTFYNLCTNQTNVENTDTVINGITSTGITFKNVNDHPNISGSTYVGWGWKAGGAGGSSNTAGSITSTVSANPTAGFSIVTYAGTGSAATVGHGLGVPPAFMILKCRDKTFGWTIYHQSLGNTRHLEFAATTGYTGDAWNSTNPTSTVFSIGTDAGSNNGSSPADDYIAYCFAEVEGYSKFGSYTGNNNSNGPFVYLGFKPALLIIKSSTSGENWHIKDSTRDTYNPIAATLLPNAANSELNLTNSIDLLSNGFKIRSNSWSGENSSNTFIYAAFAEHPFGGDGVSPATAR